MLSMNLKPANVCIAGFGMALPSTIMTNADVISKIISLGGMETTDTWIRERAGIQQRRVVKKCLNENSATLGVTAAKSALKRADLEIGDMDEIILATVTPTYKGIPSTASHVHYLLDSENSIPAYDINAGCSGFLYALTNAYYKVRYEHKKVLVIGADCLSTVINWADRGTAILFGDGAGAMVLAPTQEENCGLQFLQTDGRGNPQPLNVSEETGFIEMEGKEVYQFAVKTGTEKIAGLLKTTGVRPDEIKLVIPHQANTRINNQIQLNLQKRLTVQMPFFQNIEKYGNTSAASIPIAFTEAVQQGLLQKGDKYIMIAFGAGLTSAVAYGIF